MGDFFRVALVVPVDLSVLVWFVASAGMLWSIGVHPLAARVVAAILAETEAAITQSVQSGGNTFTGTSTLLDYAQVSGTTLTQYGQVTTTISVGEPSRPAATPGS